MQASVDDSHSVRCLLTKKEAEVKDMEDSLDKYKKYLEKAKTVGV